MVLDGAAFYALQLGVRGDRPRLSVRRKADRDGALGDRIGQLEPGVDQLVELQVQRAKQRTHGVLVRLLTDQGEVDQLDERGLQLLSGLLALVDAERWKV